MEPLRADDVRLVVGGDGTIELGTISGFLRAGFPLALLYLDGELDPRTSAENETDILGSMDIAHPIDVPGAAGALRGIGLRRPSLSADHLVDLGYERNMDGPVEADLFAWRGFADFSVAHVPQHDAEPTLAEAVGCLHSSASIRRAGSTGKEFNLDNADGEGACGVRPTHNQATILMGLGGGRIRGQVLCPAWVTTRCSPSPRCP